MSPFDVALRELQLFNGDTRLFSLKAADLRQIAYDLQANRLGIGAIALNGGELNAVRAKDGGLDWQQLVPQSAAKPGISAPRADGAALGESLTTPARPFMFDIADIRLEHWKATWTDYGFTQPLRAAVARIHIGLNVNNTDGEIAIGVLNAQLQFLSLQPVRQAEPAARLASITLTDGALSMKNSQLKVTALVMSGLQTRLVVNPDKSINWLSLLQPASASPVAKPAAKSAVRAKAGASPWKVVLDKLRLEKVNHHIEDQSTPQPVALDVQGASVELGGASLNHAKPVSVKAALAL